MHGEDAARRQQVIHDREGRLLHLAGITGAADQYDAFLEIDDDGGLGIRAVLAGVGWELRREKDGELGSVRIGGVGPDEKLAAEEAVPGELADDADRKG